MDKTKHCPSCTTEFFQPLHRNIFHGKLAVLSPERNSVRYSVPRRRQQGSCIRARNFWKEMGAKWGRPQRTRSSSWKCELWAFTALGICLCLSGRNPTSSSAHAEQHPRTIPDADIRVLPPAFPAPTADLTAESYIQPQGLYLGLVVSSYLCPSLAGVDTSST